ncbi:hypothetical protein Tco_1482998 [Tanacetum coccineum]
MLSSSNIGIALVISNAAMCAIVIAYRSSLSGSRVVVTLATVPDRLWSCAIGDRYVLRYRHRYRRSISVHRISGSDHLRLSGICESFSYVGIAIVNRYCFRSIVIAIGIAVRHRYRDILYRHSLSGMLSSSYLECYRHRSMRYRVDRFINGVLGIGYFVIVIVIVIVIVSHYRLTCSLLLS